VSGVAAGIAVLGVVQGAYSVEVIRGAILAVPAGQLEAARAMGMPPLKAAWSITLPLMLSNAIPGLANLWLIATKDTALLAIVGFAELTLQTRQAASSTTAGVLYLLITLISGILFGRIEKWARRGQRNHGAGQ
jgi:polar amino acid transport system permease protein